jgi:uncharacterized protein YqhQ
MDTPLLRRDEIARAHETEGVICQTHVGGQALIEGVMMRGKYNWAVAVREPSGDIYTEEHDLISGRGKNSWMYKPVVRGCTALVESMALGFKALEIAANHAFDLSEEDGGKSGPETTVALEPEASMPPLTELPSTAAPTFETHSPLDVATTEFEICTPPLTASDSGLHTPPPVALEAELHTPPPTASESGAIPKPLMTLSMAIGVLLGIAIFIVLPAIVTNLIVGDYGERTLLWNVVDGILRIAIFIFYIWLIGRMGDIKRMFAYHGAEHKTIHCYEHGLDLTVRNAQQFPTLHVRCGTAFLLMTMLIAIFVFTVFPVTAIIDALGVGGGVARFALIVLSRIILIPLIAGLSYELTVKWAGSRPDHPLVRLILWPGLQMQRLTTNEPDDSMVECAIAAMQRVLIREQKEHATESCGK